MGPRGGVPPSTSSRTEGTPIVLPASRVFGPRCRPPRPEPAVRTQGCPPASRVTSGHLSERVRRARTRAKGLWSLSSPDVRDHHVRHPARRGWRAQGGRTGPGRAGADTDAPCDAIGIRRALIRTGDRTSPGTVDPTDPGEPTLWGEVVGEPGSDRINATKELHLRSRSAMIELHQGSARRRARGTRP